MTGRGWLAVAIALALGLPLAFASEILPTDRRSGFDFIGPDSQALQRDDAANPGMLWVRQGEALWNRKTGAADRSCADCHGHAASSMQGVAARYPAFDSEQGRRPIDLQGRINLCRSTKQQEKPLAWESQELLALTAYVATQSRGMPVSVGEDRRLQPFLERGRALFAQRIGQLNLSCAACHDDNWGKRLGASTVPQGHPTGYPLYRLEWQGLGSVQRRFRNCLTGVRAEPYAYGSAEYVDLELYLMSRAAGLPIETPAVRP